MSKYVELMGARKAAVKKGDTKEANRLFQEAEKLKEAGKVSKEEFIAAAYI